MRIYTIKYLSILAVACLILVMSPGLVTPCGMSTHGEVAHRSAHWLSPDDYPEYVDLLNQYPECLQAGSHFPDWGYAFGFHDESEDAHWEPFMKAAADYIHETYPPPWNAETEKLVVFLMGIASHNIADISWHALGGVDEGFLQAMGHQDFHGSFGDAHDVGDFGGDVVVNYEMPLDWVSWKWFVPVDDLTQIYINYGHDTVTPQDLTWTMRLLFVALQAEQIASHLLFPLWPVDSPFLVEQFHDYFVGGLDDMAIQTDWYWPNIINWVENGVAKTGEPFQANESFAKEHDALLQTIAWGAAMEKEGFFKVTTEKVAAGVLFTAEIPEEFLKTIEKTPSTKPPISMPQNFNKMATVSFDSPYGTFGTSLATADVNGDGMEDIAVGAPGHGQPGHPQLGKAAVIYGTDKINGFEQYSFSSLPNINEWTGGDDYGRFGWALAFVDLNSDSNLDLAISAPTTGAQDARYNGKVFVFFGDGSGDFSQAADIVISTEIYHANLGYSLSSGDIDLDGFDDLIVGAPFAKDSGAQQGFAAIYLSSQSFTSGSILTTDDACWSQFGEKDYDWFGYKVGFADLGSTGRYLLVSAPEFNSAELQSAGKLYFYDTNDLSACQDTNHAFSIQGASEFAKVGSAFAIGDFYGDGQNRIALSSTGADYGGLKQTGIVRIINPELLTVDKKVDGISTHAIISGDRQFMRFGWQLASLDTNNDGASELWVSQPWARGKKGPFGGFAYLWPGGELFPKGNNGMKPDSAAVTLQSATSQTFLGANMAGLDFNGDGLDDLVIAAPRDSNVAREGGAIHVILTPQSELSDMIPSRGVQGRYVLVRLKGKNLDSKYVFASLTLNESSLSIISAEGLDPNTIQMTIKIPDDASLGFYDLRLLTVFGEMDWPAVFEVQAKVPGPEESDDDDDVQDDDDDIDPDANSDDKGEDSKIENGGGCGC